jgi:hypothetical protein
VSTQIREHQAQEKQDEAGFWHKVASTPCEECGCAYFYSLDEVGLWWEPGDDVELGCRDQQCDCHVKPVQGIRFTVRSA